MLSVSNVSMRYGAKILFDEVSTAFTPGKRYGLTGPNGAGKSTFMKLLSGELEPQKGTVVRPRKLGVLSQDQFAFDAYSAIDTVIMGNKRLWAAMQERDAIYEKPEMTDADGMKLGELEGIVGEEDGYTAESDAAILLQGLDIPDEVHTRKMSELQGGQKVRVLLAQALFGHPQALLLDEPTNHLDLDSIHWLQGFLNVYDGVVIAISHDRHFLNSICTHIADIDYETIITYTGTLRRHGRRQDAGALADRIAERAARKENFAVERIHRALRRRNAVQPGAIAAQGSRAPAGDGTGEIQHRTPVHQVRAEAPVGQAHPRNRASEQGLRREAGHSRLHRQHHPRRTNRAHGPQRSREDHAAERPAGEFSDHAGSRTAQDQRLRRTIRRLRQSHLGTRSLHRLLRAGSSQPDRRRHDRASSGCISGIAAAVTEELRGILGQMLFQRDEATKSTSVLSGGEAARLLFCKLMLQKPNVLVLDEPTNHLDLESINALNIALQRYQGTVFLVTHDHDLIDEVATRIWHFESDHKITDFKGTYEDYQAAVVAV